MSDGQASGVKQIYQKHVPENVRKLFALLLKEIGPILAGFQLAAILTSLYSIGAFARWVLEVWRPFTRRFWDWATSFIHIQLSAPEKDALTAVAFFTPLAFWSWYQHAVKNNTRKLSRSMWWIAFALSVWFVYLVSGPLIGPIIQSFNADSVNIAGFIFTPSLIYAAAFFLFYSSFFMIGFYGFESRKAWKQYLNKDKNSTLLNDAEKESNDTESLFFQGTRLGYAIYRRLIDRNTQSISSADEFYHYIRYILSRLHNTDYSIILKSKKYDSDSLHELISFPLFINNNLQPLSPIKEAYKIVSRIDHIYSRIIVVFSPLSFLSILAFPLTASVTVASQLSFTVAICVWMVISGIICTLAFDPRRLLVTLGAMVAIILGAFGFELVGAASNWMKGVAAAPPPP